MMFIVKLMVALLNLMNGQGVLQVRFNLTSQGMEFTAYYIGIFEMVNLISHNESHQLIYYIQVLIVGSHQQDLEQEPGSGVVTTPMVHKFHTHVDPMENFVMKMEIALKKLQVKNFQNCFETN